MMSKEKSPEWVQFLEEMSVGVNLGDFERMRRVFLERRPTRMPSALEMADMHRAYEEWQDGRFTDRQFGDFAYQMAVALSEESPGDSLEDVIQQIAALMNAQVTRVGDHALVATATRDATGVLAPLIEDLQEKGVFLRKDQQIQEETDRSGATWVTVRCMCGERLFRTQVDPKVPDSGNIDGRCRRCNLAFHMVVQVEDLPVPQNRPPAPPKDRGFTWLN